MMRKSFPPGDYYIRLCAYGLEKSCDDGLYLVEWKHGNVVVDEQEQQEPNEMEQNEDENESEQREGDDEIETNESDDEEDDDDDDEDESEDKEDMVESELEDDCNNDNCNDGGDTDRSIKLRISRRRFCLFRKEFRTFVFI